MKRNHQGHSLPFERQKSTVSVFERSTFTEGFSGDAKWDALVPVFPPSLKNIMFNRSMAEPQTRLYKPEIMASSLTTEFWDCCAWTLECHSSVFS